MKNRYEEPVTLEEARSLVLDPFLFLRDGGDVGNESMSKNGWLSPSTTLSCARGLRPDLRPEIADNVFALGECRLADADDAIDDWLNLTEPEVCRFDVEAETLKELFLGGLAEMEAGED